MESTPRDEEPHPRIEQCPECGSDDIGQLDEGLPLATDEYEAAGGRYYCLRCGWSEQMYEGRTGLQSWCYGWPEVECAKCGKTISHGSARAWIDPNDPDRVLCYECRDKEVNPPGWRVLLRRITGGKTPIPRWSLCLR